MSNDIYYRYEDHLVWSEDYSCDAQVRIHLLSYYVMKRTACGVWLNHRGKRKFVLNNSNKRFAYETKELALTSFIARKRRQVLILRNQLETTEKALSLAALERGLNP